MTFMIELTLQSHEHTAFINITQSVQKTVRDNDWNDGVLTVYIPHTTAGVTIQENADPDVVTDLIYLLEKIVPWRDPKYKHNEGNTAAHLKTAMLGTSAQIIVKDAELQLGTWQGIYFCEFDGPRNRTCWLTFNAAR